MKHIFRGYSGLFMAAMFLLNSCMQEGQPAREYVQGPFRVQLRQESDSMHTLYLSIDGTLCDSMPLPYPVYRMDCGDLTGDGVPEICVGVEKPTRYWPHGRRLFIYHLYRRKFIRPLWLGSRVGLQLVDFSVCRDSVPACIHTVERRRDSTLVRNEYFFRGFGLQFRKHLDGPSAPSSDNQLTP